MNETPSCIIVVTQCNFTEFKQLKGWLHGSYQKLSFFQCQKWVRDLLETSFVPFLYSVKINLLLGFPAFSPMGLVEVGMDLSEMTFFTQLPRRRDSESIKRNSTLGIKHSGRSKMENFTRYRTCRTHMPMIAVVTWNQWLYLFFSQKRHFFSWEEGTSMLILVS